MDVTNVNALISAIITSLVEGKTKHQLEKNECGLKYVQKFHQRSSVQNG